MVWNSHIDDFVVVFVLRSTLSPQVSIVSKRTHVCLAHVPTVVTAMLCPTTNSLVPVFLVTKAPVVSMTQMSVPPSHLCARTEACVWTPQAHIDATANPALPAPTARTFTCLAFHPPASMVEPVDRWRTQLMSATVCQVSSLIKEIYSYFDHSKRNYRIWTEAKIIKMELKHVTQTYHSSPDYVCIHLELSQTDQCLDKFLPQQW